VVEDFRGGIPLLRIRFSLIEFFSRYRRNGVSVVLGRRFQIGDEIADDVAAIVAELDFLIELA
jgi:hypothetical protein